MYKQLVEHIDKIDGDLSKDQFTQLVLEVFQFQRRENKIYSQWVDMINPKDVSNVDEIPFLPIEAFRSYEVKSGSWIEEQLFRSSGTTSESTSRHYVRSTKHYLDNCVKGWKEVFVDPKDLCFLALLPSYLEREDSSLIAMVSDFINRSKFEESGFFLDDHKELYKRLCKCKALNIPTVLFGVSFALTDFAEEFAVDFPELIVMETGGMKGRKKEMSRLALHGMLKSKINVHHVYSEYGMTELMSQAYTRGDEWFRASSTMKILARDLNDPLGPCLYDRTGRIDIIDLANLDTCCFIATQDLGVVRRDGLFKIEGRVDHSALRGCNLMVSDLGL